MEAITTAFQTAIGAVSSDALTLIGTALPSALAVGGVMIAVGAGWRLFKRFSK